MIQEVLQHIATKLNSYLKRVNGLSEDVVVLSSLLDTKGSSSDYADNKLVIFLTNIERETVHQKMMARTQSSDGRDILHPQFLCINLYVMVAANYSGSKYPEALKFISKTISFFHTNPVFDRASSPELDHRIDRVALEMENLNIQDLSNLWGLLGGRYLPSVYYRIRLVLTQDDSILDQIPYVSSPKADVN